MCILKTTRLLLVTTVLVLVVVCCLYFKLTSSRHPHYLEDMVLGESKEEYFDDFIDPNYDLCRKFHGSRLLGPQKMKDGAPRNRKPDVASTPSPTVTVFQGHGEPVQNAKNMCVPFHGPKQHTFRMCVYESDVDQMISAAIRDQGRWEKEQVEDMASVLRSNREQVFHSPTGVDVRTESDMGERGDGVRKSVRSGRQTDKDSSLHSGLVDKVHPLDGAVFQGNETKHRTQGDLSPQSGAVPRSEDTPSQDYPGDLLTVVDIGCNVGVYALTAAVLGHPVVAVDPVVSNLQLLASSLHLAGLASRVTLLLNAIMDTPGLVNVHVNPSNVGGSWVKKVAGGSRQRQARMPTKAASRPQSPRQAADDRQAQGGGDQQGVWAVCLDHLVPHVPTRRVFLKMDVEGGEDRVLRCAGYFFQQLHVTHVQMEWLFFRVGSGGPRVIEFLVRNGFLPYTDITQTVLLSPKLYWSWPDNVMWIKR